MNTESPLSRRAFVIGSGLTAASVALMAPGMAFARGRLRRDVGIVELLRTQASTAKITTVSLRGGIRVLMGAGGNVAVLTGRDGKVLVDAGVATAKRQMADALSAISPDSITHLINSHWHFDHTDGNQWLHSEGALIVGHESTRRRLAVDTYVKGWDFTFPASPSAALPIITFKNSLALHLNNTTLSLESFAPAHTDSDILVEFTEHDVMHVGDVWWNGHYPFIDYSTGGSIDGTIRAVEVCLSRVKDSTVIIPGHGPVGDKSQLAGFRDMLTTVRQRVAEMKNHGRSLAEIVAAKPTLEFDPKFGHFLLAPADFTGLVFAGV